MEIKTKISKLLKPSLPTPSNLQTYHLSFFDEQMPNFNIPLILYYASSPNPQTIFNHLETSLTETLTDFYPLAGRYMHHGSFVDCSDQGALYVEAVSSFQLSEFLDLTWELKYNMFDGFMPCDVGKVIETDDPLLSIKVTTLQCGGVVIGMCFSHKVSDMASFCTFIDNWASRNYRKTSNVEVNLGRYLPIFNLLRDFPKKDVVDPTLSFTASLTTVEKTTARVFRFKGNVISKLRESVVLNDERRRRPSKVQLVMALLWKVFVAIDKANDTKPKASIATLGVNLRNKVVPKLPDNLFGNFVNASIAQLEAGQGDNIDLQGLLMILNESIKKIEGDYVKELTADNVQYEVLAEPFLESRRIMVRDDVRLYMFTSWCKFSFYNADFGCGKPVWRSSAKYDYNNMAILMDDEEGDGVEAWVHLDEKRMRLMEQNLDIQAYAI